MVEFKKITDINMENMIEWCKEHDEVKWLKAEVHKTEQSHKVVKVVDENGMEVKKRVPIKKELSFVTLRSRFVNKFMPEIKVGNKKKEPTFRDIVDAL